MSWRQRPVSLLLLVLVLYVMSGPIRCELSDPSSIFWRMEQSFRDCQVHLSQSFEDGVFQLRWGRDNDDLTIAPLPMLPPHLRRPPWLIVPATDVEQSAVLSSREASAGEASAKLLQSSRYGDDDDDDFEPSSRRLLRRKTKL